MLGYFSGSLAHEADFNEALAAIAEVMDQRLDVSLLVVGHLRERPEFKKWSNRVHREAFADYATYLELLAACDLVIVRGPTIRSTDARASFVSLTPPSPQLP